MSLLDWVILIAYFIGMILLSVYLGKGQEDQEDYYVGGRSLPWWAVGLSTMATQSSAISFVSIPAFVAIKKGGGLSWLQYEFAVPLAMIFIMIFLIPFFRKLELITVFEYLEQRFGALTRGLLSSVFLLSRIIATGVALYLVALVMAVPLKLDPILVVVLVGLITVIYDTIGGMKAVVYSDVVQMGVLLIGILALIGYSIKVAGGLHGIETFFQAEPSRFIAVDFRHHGLGDGSLFNFWAMVIGGFFLYASYYGCDQTQTQRELSAPTLDDTKRSLVFNGFFRFPLVAMYVLVGVALGAAYVESEELRSLLAPWIAKRADYALPVFIIHYIPIGLKGLIFAAILAAAMSSLDSGINSLSAVFMRDFYERYINPRASSKQYFTFSKITTAVIGLLVILVAAMLVSLPKLETALELINRIGSLFYGPILATFLVGALSKRVNALGINVGLIAGVLANLALWIGMGDKVSWLWWNAIGFAVTTAVAYLMNLTSEGEATGPTYWELMDIKDERRWIPIYLMLFAYFSLMVMLALALPNLLRWLAKLGV